MFGFPYQYTWSVRTRATLYITQPSHTLFFSLISCARACTVASEVFTEAQSFADCKLHIRTRLLAFGFQQFLENPFPCLFLDLISGDVG